LSGRACELLPHAFDLIPIQCCLLPVSRFGLAVARLPPFQIETRRWGRGGPQFGSAAKGASPKADSARTRAPFHAACHKHAIPLRLARLVHR
jgi:hypothetical protein